MQYQLRKSSCRGLHVCGVSSGFNVRVLTCMCAHAEVMKRTVDGMTQLTAEDLMGWSKAQSGSLPQSAKI